MSTLSSCSAPLATLVLAVISGSVSGAIPAYQFGGSFAAPSNSAAFDVQSDGRLIAVDGAGQVLRQSTLNGSTYVPMGSLPAGTLPSFGPGFVRVSPDGATIAIGDNGSADRVYTVSTAALSTSTPTTPGVILSPNFDAVWTSASDLFIAGAPSSGAATPGVYRASTSSGVATRVIGNIGDGSGGIAVIGSRMYTGIGFDFAFLRSGEIRSFELGALESASSAVDFNAGSLLGQHNTASSFAVDAQGNLVVGGFGGVAVVDVATNASYVLPGLSNIGFYAVTFNSATSEILVRDFGATDILRFGVPSPAASTLFALCGVFAARRRR